MYKNHVQTFQVRIFCCQLLQLQLIVLSIGLSHLHLLKVVVQCPITRTVYLSIKLMYIVLCMF